MLPDEHRWHFSPSSLKRMLSKTGFSVVETSFANHPYGRGSIKRVAGMVLSWTSLALRMGEAMLVIARKTVRPAGVADEAK